MDANQLNELATNALQINDNLPEWSDCELAVDEKRATALERFIYDYEPSDADQWRGQLAAVVRDAMNRKES